MNGVQRGIKALAICFAIFLIVNIVGWIIYGVSFLIYIGEDSNINNSETVKENYTYEENEYSNISKIDIDIATSTLVIKKGEKLKVDTEESRKVISVNAVNGKLKIEEKGKMVWNWNNHNINNITIYIPDNLILEELKIDAGAGKIEIDETYAKEFKISHGAGRLEILNSKFEEIDIDGGAGETVISSSSLNDLKLSAGVGRVEINANITGKSEIECGIGELDLTLKGNKEDYKIMAEKGLGSIKIDGDEQENDIVFGKGENLVKLEGRNRKHKSKF